MKKALSALCRSRGRSAHTRTTTTRSAVLDEERGYVLEVLFKRIESESLDEKYMPSFLHDLIQSFIQKSHRKARAGAFDALEANKETNKKARAHFIIRDRSPWLPFCVSPLLALRARILYVLLPADETYWFTLRGPLPVYPHRAVRHLVRRHPDLGVHAALPAHRPPRRVPAVPLHHELQDHAVPVDGPRALLLPARPDHALPDVPRGGAAALRERRRALRRDARDVHAAGLRRRLRWLGGGDGSDPPRVARLRQAARRRPRRQAATPGARVRSRRRRRRQDGRARPPHAGDARRVVDDAGRRVDAAVSVGEDADDRGVLALRQVWEALARDAHGVREDVPRRPRQGARRRGEGGAEGAAPTRWRRVYAVPGALGGADRRADLRLVCDLPLLGG